MTRKQKLERALEDCQTPLLKALIELVEAAGNITNRIEYGITTGFDGVDKMRQELAALDRALEEMK